MSRPQTIRVPTTRIGRPGRSPGDDDPAATWTTEEIGAEPSRLAEVIAGARADETLLIEDLGGWVDRLLDPAQQPVDAAAAIDELAAAVRACAGRLVLVSPEVGLALMPTTPVGRAFVDTLGSINQAVAEACDAVVLVVAGQPAWLKTGTGSRRRAGARLFRYGADRADRRGPGAGWTVTADARPGRVRPRPATGLVIQPGLQLPLPDEQAGPLAIERLADLDLPGSGLGHLAQVVGFAAGTQGRTVPTGWQSVRVLLLHGDHDGGAAAGTAPDESARRARQARTGTGPLAQLAAEVGATLQVVEAPTAAPMEDGPALDAEAVESALRYGWQLAEEAAEQGVQVIVLAACGDGTDAAAAAVLAATAGAEPAAVLDRVIGPGGRVDDEAWMARCTAVRDALRRTRHGSRNAKDILAELGGGDIAIATGVLLGAAAQRTPVLLDGPVGVAAGLISRDLAGQTRHWCLLPDHGNHPAVRLAADVLGLTPLLDLRLNLGEGATALTTLPLLRTALTLAGTLPGHPALEPSNETGTPESAESSEFSEPEPAGPGPSSTPASG